MRGMETAFVAAIHVSDERCGEWSFERAPRKHCELARRRLKEIRRRSQLMSEKFIIRFCDKRNASLLIVFAVIGPQLPLEENTHGMKEPCSTSRTRSAYLAIFLCS